MGQRIDVNHLNIYYGDFLAVEDVNINIESEFLQSNNRGAVQIPAGALQIGFADQPKRAITELRFAKHNPLTSSS